MSNNNSVSAEDLLDSLRLAASDLANKKKEISEKFFLADFSSLSNKEKCEMIGDALDAGFSIAMSANLFDMLHDSVKSNKKIHRNHMLRDGDIVVFEKRAAGLGFDGRII